MYRPIFMILLEVFLSACFCLHAQAQTSLYVCISDSVHVVGIDKDMDGGQGSLKNPFHSIQAALRAAGSRKGAVTIYLRKGVYYLDSTLVIKSEEASFESLKIQNYQDEKVVISAGRALKLNWQPFENGIYQAKLPLQLHFETLFINDEKQVLARCPNYNPAVRILQGTSADATAKEKISSWKHPAGGYLHGLQAYEWGSLHYKIIGSNPDGTLRLVGGWQNNRPSSLHKDYRYVENIFEELDTAKEWFLDKKDNTLYYKPPKGLDLQTAKVVVSHLRNSLEIRGSSSRPVPAVHIQGIHFTNNERTFMETKEPLLRSDWRLYRGGAVLLDGTADCSVEDCDFHDLGGNAIMVSGFNKGTLIRGCHIYRVGASAICFVGKREAVRSPLDNYAARISYDQLDKTPGPLTNDYPDSCTADNNLIDSIGLIEKQVAGIEIDIAAGIHITHNTIYQVPRAGINIGDGCFGGHEIAYNEVFRTVLETGDHGAFNSWGRDRFWNASRAYMDSLVALHPELRLLDAQEKNIIHNNLFSCNHGWDIDLDDGSSNYEIFNNLCLAGGIKFREGFYRSAYNNIMINNSFHPHVWFKNSHDSFRHNIVMQPYKPIRVTDWGDRVDDNWFLTEAALQAARTNGTDAHSLQGNPMFTNPDKGDYNTGNQALTRKAGFKNFRMDQFGVELPRLKKLAAKPDYPVLNVWDDQPHVEVGVGTVKKNKISKEFRGATLKSVEGLGDRSAYGLPDESGVIVLSVRGESPFAKAGLLQGDVIRSFEGTRVKGLAQLLQLIRPLIGSGKSVSVGTIRSQQSMELKIRL